MLQVSELPFAEGVDLTSALLAGSLFLFSLLLVQAIWFYRGRSVFGSSPSSAASSETGEEAGNGMVICPECSEPTEAEYRYCRHCASDTGKSYVGSTDDDGSNRSGML